MFQSRVLAQFPTEGADTLIPLADVERAIIKEFTEKEWQLRPRRKVIGIDVARYGDDTTVFIGMDNYKQVAAEWHNSKDTMKTVGKARQMFDDLGMKKHLDTFIIDDTGVGGGVTDRLSELGYNVIPINNASASNAPEKFENIKAEIFFHLRSVFKNNEIKVMEKGRLIGELPTIKYEYNSKQKLCIVSKKKMKRE